MDPTRVGCLAEGPGTWTSSGLDENGSLQSTPRSWTCPLQDVSRVSVLPQLRGHGKDLCVFSPKISPPFLWSTEYTHTPRRTTGYTTPPRGPETGVHKTLEGPVTPDRDGVEGSGRGQTGVNGRGSGWCPGNVYEKDDGPHGKGLDRSGRVRGLGSSRQ